MYVCMYVCMYVKLYYVCLSRLGMLIFCTGHALKVWRAHASALLLSAGHRAPVLEYDRSICTMDNRPTKDEDDCMKGAIKDNVLSGVSTFSSYSA